MTWEDEIDFSFACPHCGTDDCVPPAGPKKSPILLIGEAPGNAEIIKGKPFVGPTGGILREELRMLSIDIKMLRLANLWIHKPNGREGCRNYSIETVIKEAKGKKAVLLIGSETVLYFTNKQVMSVNGLKVKSPLLSPKILMACVQPATVFHQSIGELRFALSQFAKEIDNLL